MEINLLTSKTDWRHVRSNNNTADILSRGANATELLQKCTWFYGPEFLVNPESTWPTLKSEITYENLPERKPLMQACNTIVTVPDLFKKYESFTVLQRIVAWIRRFINNCKRKTVIKSTFLTVAKLNESLYAIIRPVQEAEFNSEYTHLLKGRSLPKESKLLFLSPFMDKKSSMNNNRKYPLLMPKSHYLTKRLIKQQHEINLHAPLQATLAATRQNFWIVSARSVVKQELHKCLKCFKINPVSLTHKMGDLPEARVRPSRPFFTTGIDYAGPILAKESRGRGKKLIKTYIVLFICFSTQAVHIELASDLSTEEFFGAFKRFISRRGCPRDIFSDNGSNFLDARNELRELYTFLKKQSNAFSFELAKHNITWHFIPPRSPHMGGLWEANIKAVKRHLKTTVGNAHLTFNALYTVLVQIEACLNSRPLTPLSSSPDDLQALTPSHFLIGKPLNTLPDNDLKEVPVNRLSRWQHVEKLRQHFWTRWSREYLNTMQVKGKWFRETADKDLIGAMVLLVEDNLPPLSWRLGRICETHPGADGVVRVVSVRTAQGIVKRTVRKLCALPMDSDTASA